MQVKLVWKIGLTLIYRWKAKNSTSTPWGNSSGAEYGYEMSLMSQSVLDWNGRMSDLNIVGFLIDQDLLLAIVSLTQEQQKLVKNLSEEDEEERESASKPSTSSPKRNVDYNPDSPPCCSRTTLTETMDTNHLPDHVRLEELSVIVLGVTKDATFPYVQSPQEYLGQILGSNTNLQDYLLKDEKNGSFYNVNLKYIFVPFTILQDQLIHQHIVACLPYRFFATMRFFPSWFTHLGSCCSSLQATQRRSAGCSARLQPGVEACFLSSEHLGTACGSRRLILYLRGNVDLINIILHPGANTKAYLQLTSPGNGTTAVGDSQISQQGNQAKAPSIGGGCNRLEALHEFSSGKQAVLHIKRYLIYLTLHTTTECHF
ncbi:hypothetical protein LAZ67_5001168 [Cordylochernes scorpioides]|uniref:Uncharacterized protein n=1 Tax=Cordylochernes scorpioides TaxID=51811 RepID=A0ABY6KK57_9ARAC|nr:hypothetical protein LAZ67_5001168 [Cordylochernes scorpioides]